MDKEFKTIDELVALLESRNVRTDSETADILRKEGYYAIVNGYKGPFLDREAMQRSPDDVYRDGTTFRQMYDLFLLDRSLRSAVFPYLLEAQTAMTNAVVYAFCERNRAQDAYLDRENYTSAREMLFPRAFRGQRSVERDKRLNELMRRLTNKLRIRETTRPYVRHYLERYGKVPLWVLQNDLTFGNIEHFYQLQKRGIQNAACKAISEMAGHGRRVAARELLGAFGILVGFRIICAHEDRLYCARVDDAGFGEMLDTLGLVLPNDRLLEMRKRVACSAAEFSGRVDLKAPR